MGAIHFSIDKGLVDLFRRALPLDTFVETGTFEGDSVDVVRADFREIYSIDCAESYHRNATARFAGAPSVHLLLGNSPDLLVKLRPKLADASVLYWLDAHWCVAGTPIGDESAQCPLLAELDAIGALNERSVLLIDDARYFLAPPPAPMESSHWPDFDSIVRKLFALSAVHRLMVLNDVIVFFPDACRGFVGDYARAAGFDLLSEVTRARHFTELEGEFRQSNAEKSELVGEMARRIEESARMRQELSAICADRDRLARQASQLEREGAALRQTLEDRSREAAVMQHEADRLRRTLSGIQRTFWYRTGKAFERALRRLRGGAA